MTRRDALSLFIYWTHSFRVIITTDRRGNEKEKSEGRDYKKTKHLYTVLIV